MPPKETVLCDFVALSEIVGPDSIGWRYDPIFLSDTYTVERHIQEFTRMAAVLAGHTHTCVISFIDLYEKVRRNFPQVQGVSRADRLTLGKAFVEIGRQYGLTIRPCAEGDELAPYGADCSGCMNGLCPLCMQKPVLRSGFIKGKTAKADSPPSFPAAPGG